MTDDLVAGERDRAAAGTPPLPPVRRSPGLRPALLVVGIAVVLVLAFGLAAAFTGQSTTHPPSDKPAKVAGTSLLAVPAGSALRSIEQPGTPPENIVNAITVPEGTQTTAHADNTTSAGQYDEQVDLRVPASQAAVVAFYRAELATRGWKTINVGTATDQPGTTQVLAQAAGDDGWYWEIGALVSPTVFGGTGGQSTPFTIRLFQVPDEN
ncbi:MAG TPA: hypothetical protein VHW47_00340 [Acidimicrobiales bacterium]|nr:hypothetical protein [Acidimicrobiales bacterium]